MAIVGNKSTEIGDIIRISTNSPIIGVVGLSSFVDDTVGETVTRYFEKYFRYSTDGGINFSSWVELSTLNLSNIDLTRKSQFVIEYRYTRAGADATGDLYLNQVEVSGDFQPSKYPVFQTTPFTEFFDINDIGVLGWALNVLEKLYDKGLLPEYMTRKHDEDDPATADEDFLDFWGAITHYFAVIVYFARQFQDVRGSEVLLPRFIESLGLFTKTNPTTVHLQYLFDNYKAEFAKRGTEAITSIGDENTPDGELLRLINYQAPEEFMLALLEPHVTGWCVSKSSPCSNHTRHSLNIVKGYEKTEDISSASNYPLTQIQPTVLGDGSLSCVSVAEGIKVGIYPYSNFDDLMIPVNDTLSYEIIAKVSQVTISNTLNFGVKSYDKDKNEIINQTLFDLSESDYFFSKGRTINASNQATIRGIIHGRTFTKGSIDTSEFLLNLGQGYDLKFNSSYETKYVLPFLYAEYNGGVSTYKIIDLKIRPLHFNFTLGKLGTKKILYMLYRNMSIYNNDDIYRNTKDKLVPFNSTLIDNEF